MKAIPDGSAIMEEIDRYAAITSRMRWDTSLAIVGCRFGHSISEFLEQIDSMCPSVLWATRSWEG